VQSENFIKKKIKFQLVEAIGGYAIGMYGKPYVNG